MGGIYQELKNEAEALNEQIYEELDPNWKARFSKEKCCEIPVQTDNLEIQNCILILGMNPSSNDLQTKNEPNDCFLEYIPDHCYSGETEAEIVKNMKEHGFTYDTYFKKFYNLFETCGYHMLWQTGTKYLRLHKDELDKLGENYYDFLVGKTCVPNRNFLIFSDLCFIKMTDSKPINVCVQKHSKEVYELFLKQLDYYRPRLVLIANVKASCLIREQFHNLLGNSENVTQSTYRGIQILYAPMLTGQHSIDRFSLLRLQKEIEVSLNGRINQ